MIPLLLLSLLLGVAIGLLRGGSLRELAYIDIKWSPVLLLALAIRILLSPEAWQTSLGVAHFGDILYPILDGLVVLFLALNLRLPGFVFLAGGQASNLLVKLLNGGKMPVDPLAAERMGFLAESQALREQGFWLHSTFIDAETRLSFLGDIIYLGPPFPWPQLLSIGDVLLILGIVVSLQGIMAFRDRRREFRATREAMSTR